MATEEGTRYPAWAVVCDARRQASLSIETLSTLTGLTAHRIVDLEEGNESPVVDELFLILRECGLELRMSVAKPDEQRGHHAQAAAHRNATARIQANTAGLRTYVALRNAQRI